MISTPTMSALTLAYTGTWYVTTITQPIAASDSIQNSGHVQTETYRQGLHGPYSMTFSRSGTPSSTLDTSFFADLDIKGYVATSGRGYVKGTASGAESTFKWVIHWYVQSRSYWNEHISKFRIGKTMPHSTGPTLRLQGLSPPPP